MSEGIEEQGLVRTVWKRSETDRQTFFQHCRLATDANLNYICATHMTSVNLVAVKRTLGGAEPDCASECMYVRYMCGERE